MSNKNIITQEGYDKLVAELNDLKRNGRKDAADKIREATEFGDLSENSEYDAAKEYKSQLETRIAYLEEFINNVTIVSIDANDIVSLGKTVTIKNLTDNNEQSIHIVGNNEAAPLKKYFSLASPVGQALLNKKTGDIVEIDAPKGKYSVEIIAVDLT